MDSSKCRLRRVLLYFVLISLFLFVSGHVGQYLIEHQEVSCIFHCSFSEEKEHRAWHYPVLKNYRRMLLRTTLYMVRSLIRMTFQRLFK